jgi:hypothetical protein
MLGCVVKRVQEKSAVPCSREAKIIGTVLHVSLHPSRTRRRT